jgi:hypothetical protein
MSTFWQQISKWSPWGLVSGLYQRFTSPIAPVCEEAQPCCELPAEDMVILQLADLQIHLRRQKTVDGPSEIHVIVPRVEIRRHYTRPDGCGGEEELIYNSVTVVHAPRHGATSEPTVIPLYEYNNTERTAAQKPTWSRKK